MELEHLLDPQRLARVWAKKIPERTGPDCLEAVDEPPDAPQRSQTRAKPPTIEEALVSLERELVAHVPEGTEDHRIALGLLQSIRESARTKGVSVGELDELEDLLDALLASRGWPISASESSSEASVETPDPEAS